MESHDLLLMVREVLLQAETDSITADEAVIRVRGLIEQYRQDDRSAYCAYCDSSCEYGECDPPYLCRKHFDCPVCNTR